MKENSLKILAAVLAGLFVIGTTLYAQGVDTRKTHAVMTATAITKADADTKYPPPHGNYPRGNRNPHDPSGVVTSPYPPYQQYDCYNSRRIMRVAVPTR